MPEPLLVTLDFESYYDSDYSLSKMSTRDYITDPRFEAILCSFHVGSDSFVAVGDADIRTALARIPWERTFMAAHNARFDGGIVKWRYGYTPALYVCTMAMAQALVYPHTGSASLAACAKHFKLPPKGDEVVQAKNMRLSHFSPAALARYAAYSQHDNALCRELLQRLLPHMSPSELRLIDLNIRCYVEPPFTLDADLLAQHLNAVRQEKDFVLDKALLMLPGGLGGTADKRTVLRSNDQFADLLRSLYVTPPLKKSLRTGKMTYAFAKTDFQFAALQEHPNPAVQAVIAARLGVKSTLEETRSERLLEQAVRYGDLAVPLKYYGAHTGRFSGDEKINLQNLTRGSPIRHAMRAPPGCKVVTADASQIEARILATLAGQEDLRQGFASGADVYASFATQFAGEVVSKETHPRERQIGKIGILSLGYGAGLDRFFDMLRSEGVDIRIEDAIPIHALYRSTYTQIKEYWYAWDNIIRVLEKGHADSRFGPLHLEGDRVFLPGRSALHYADIEKTDEGYTYRQGRRRVKIYGAKLTENVTQYLARIVTLDAGPRIVLAAAREGIPCRFALQVHDELVFTTPAEAAERLLEIMLREMRVAPDWLPDVPLDAEGGIGDSYGDAK